MASLSTLRVRAARSRYGIGLALTAALAFSAGSRVHLAASPGTTTFGQAFAQNTVFATTLQSATPSSGVVLPAEARRFAKGQLARVYLDCAALAMLPAGTPGADVCGGDSSRATAPVDVVLQSVNRTTGALTWSGWSVSPLPIAPLPGARIESAVFGPGNIAVDASGRLYLADTWNSRIAVFAADGTALFTVGEYGSVYTLRNNPADADADGIADDPMSGYPDAGALAVCYDALGTQAGTGCTNDPAQQLGFFNTPNDVAVSADGSTIAVADSGNHRVQILKINSAGTLVASDGVTRFSAMSLGSWGEGLGTPAGKMSYPAGVALGANGRIVIVDTDNSRVQTFDPDASAAMPVRASNGTLYRATTFGQHGDSGGATRAFELNYPLDVAVDPSGRIVVADSGNNQIKVYNAAGTAAVALLGGPAGLDLGLFNYPWGVNADANGNLLVADTFAQRLQVLTKTSTGYVADSTIQLPPVLSPIGVTATPDGGLAVSEFDKHRILKLAPLGIAVDGTVSVSQSTVASGEQVAVSFRVKNTGRATLKSVQPALSGLGTATVVPCTATAGAGLTLAPGATADVSVCFVAGNPTPALALTVSASGSAGPMQVRTDDVAVPAIVVEPAGLAAMALTATASDTRVARDATVTITLRLRNTGRVQLTGTQVSVPAVQGMALVAQPAGALTIASMAKGADTPITVSYRASQLGHFTLQFSATSEQKDVATGAAVTATASVDIDVVSDVDPPAIVSAAVTGPAGELPGVTGWIQYGPATLTLTAADAGDGLQSISYRSLTGSAGSMTVAAGQRAATFAAGPFYSYGGGDTLVAFWAEDVSGNTRRRDLMPREVTPGSVETVQSFCGRLPRQCVWIKIDPLKPFLEHYAPTLTPDNSEARIKFDATDSQSGVAALRLAGSQPGARIEMEAGSNSRGTLVLTNEGAQVFGDVSVTDFAGLEGTFRLPVTGSGKPAVRLDRTPPEAFNQLDPAALGASCTTTIAGKAVKYLCANKVFATDDQPGMRTSAIAPAAVIATRWGGDYDSPADRDDDDDRNDDDDHEHHRGLEGHWDDDHDGFCDFHRWSRFNDDHRYGYTAHDKNRDGKHDANCRERHDGGDRKPAPRGYRWLSRGYDWWFSDRDRDTHSHWFCDHDHDWDGGVAELHTYSVTDETTPAAGTTLIQNPNKVTLVEKLRQSGNELRVRVVSYQYSQGSVAGPVIVPDWAIKKYEWETERGALKSLNQKMEVGKGRSRVQVLATYDARTNKTTIRELGPAPEKKTIRTGLVLLRMTTDDGRLTIAY